MERGLLAFIIFLEVFLTNFFHVAIAQEIPELPKEIQEKILSNNKDTAKVHALHAACKIYIGTQKELTIVYAKQAENLSEEIGYVHGMAYSQYIEGYTYSLVSKFELAFKSYLEALKNFTETDDKTYIAKTCNELGIIYKNMGKYQEAIDIYDLALKNTEETGNTNFTINLLINTGVVYMKMSGYKEAASYLFRALQLSEEIKDFRQTALVHGNLGNLYMEQEVYTEAENHFTLALNNFKNTGNSRMEAVALNNLGKVFIKLKQNERAIVSYDRATKLFNEIGDNASLADCLKNLGLLYLNEGDPGQALNNFKASLELYNELNNEVHLAELYALIGGAYLSRSDFNNANFYLTLAIDNESKIIKDQDKLTLYKNKYLYHEALAGFRDALIYHKKYTALREELLNNEKLQEINKIETRYKTEKQEKENQILKVEQEQNKEEIGKKELINRFLMLGIVVFLFTVIHFYRLSRQKNKNNKVLTDRNNEIEKNREQIIKINADLEKSQKDLKEANTDLNDLNLQLNSILQKKTNQLNQTSEELDTFFYQSSHALRRPVVHFKGLLEILKLEKDEKSLLELHKKLDYTFNKMDVMLSKLVMASEINLEKGMEDTVNFKMIIEAVWVYLGIKYKLEDFKLNINVQPSLVYRGNNKLIEILFQNLLENAINFSALPELRKTIIDVHISEENAYLKIVFKDNGIGIPEQQLSKIFGMFTVASHISEGFGLGLYIVKKVITKLGGHISVKSTENEFTSFTITLPKNKVIYLEDLNITSKNKRLE